MKKIFIDVGAYDGDTIEQFLNWGKLVDNPSEYKIYAFEPNPNMLPELRKKVGNIEIIESAAWVDDNGTEFAVDTTETPIGSTVMSSKKNIWDNFEKIKVATIDFSNWLKQFKGDHVVIKMDIEGAEFPVLRKMIDDGTITIADKIFVEFHPNKVQDYTSTDKENLINEIKSLGVNIQDWH